MIEKPPITSESIATAIHGALRTEIERVAEEELAVAQQKIEQRVRQQLGAIATTILSRYDISFDGMQILIRVEDVRK